MFGIGRKPATDPLLDVYMRRREVSRGFANRAVATIGNQALDDAARRLGLLHRGVYVFGSEHEGHVLFDHALFTPLEDGRSPMARYVEANPPPPGTEKAVITEAMVGARYRVLKIEQVMPGLGAMVNSFVEEGRLLIDIGLSHTGAVGALFATRLFVFDEFMMTSGAGLPVFGSFGKKCLQAVMQRTSRPIPGVASDSQAMDHEIEKIALPILLAGGAGRRMATAYAEDIAAGRMPEAELFDGEEIFIGDLTGGSPRRGRAGAGMPQHTSANAPCPCGSGRKYKKCCGKVGVR